MARSLTVRPTKLDMQKILPCLLGGLIIGGCVINKYVPFHPVYRVGDELVASETQYSQEFRQNIKQVFDFYQVPYKEDINGNIFIPNQLSKDKDTMWNYTTKANDREWLDTHQ